MNITKEIEELRNKIVMTEAELKKQEAEHGEYELHLCKISVFNTNEVVYSLDIGFKYGGCYHSVGNISEEGKCYFFNNHIRRSNWELWKEHGFKVAEQEPVEWHNIKWELKKSGHLFINGKGYNYVYCFLDKTTCRNIQADDGFLKKDSDNRIHLF